MGDDAPSGKKYAPEQLAATTQALEALYTQLYQNPPVYLSVEDLKAWHARLATSLGIVAGHWRTGPVTFGTYYGFAAQDIEDAVQSTFAIANEHLSYVDCLEDEPELQLEELVRVAGYLHARLIKIHPFEDGNGRISRLVLAALFWRFGFDFPDISHLQKTRYIAALNKYNSYGTDDLYCQHLEPLQTLLLELL